MQKITKEQIEYFAMVGEIIGAIAVVISVIYLAMQVGDSNDEMRSQTHYNALMLAQRPMEMLIENPELGDLLTKGSCDVNSLTPTEWDRLSHYVFLLFYRCGQNQANPEIMPKRFWNPIGVSFATVAFPLL